MRAQFTLKNKVLASLAGLALVTSLVLPRLALADVNFLGGDIFTGTNNTTGNGTWSDPVSANPGEVVEFRIVAQNQSTDTTAHNVLIRADLPQTDGTSDVATATITSDSGAKVQDNLTVNILGGSKQRFGDVVPGHTRLFGGPCPNGCFVDDAATTSGINVGDLAPGQSVQILFKAWISNFVIVSPTPTPTATPTPTPTPTGTPVPTPTATPVPSGINIVNNNVNVNKNENENNVTANGGSATNTNTINVTATAPAAQPQVIAAAAAPSVKQLPQTGLPLAGLALGGLLPAGLKLKKFGKGSEDTEETSANHIWEDRQFKRS